MSEANFGFDYVVLNEVDPSFKAIPQAYYTLQVLDAKRGGGAYANDIKNKAGEVIKHAGDPFEYVTFAFAITDDPTYSGRRVWDTLFFGEKELRYMRKLADNTGIEQKGSFNEWLQALKETKPTLKTLVTEVASRRDPNTTENRISWKDIVAA